MNLKQKLVSTFPLIVLSGLLVNTFIIIYLTGYEYQGEIHYQNFNIKHYLAYGSVILCWVLIGVRFDIGILTLSLVLVFGTFSLVNFIVNEYSWSWTLTWSETFSVGIEVQAISFVALLLNIFLNKSTHTSIYNKYLKPAEADNTDELTKQTQLISAFKSKYRNKTPEELIKIANSNYQEAAKIAAQELLVENDGK